MTTFIQFLKSQFLPGQCCLCKQAADIKISLCEKCRSKLPKNDCRCSCCATPLNSGELNISLLCGSCQQQPPFFDRVFSPFLYQQHMVQLIHQFKYHSKLFLGNTLADIFIQQYPFDKNCTDQIPEVIIPVPLHIKRLKHRGFNQSKELAIYFSRQMNIKIRDDIVKRVKLTHTQQGLSLIERKKNLKNAFSVNDNSFDNKYVVLVDDVMTTGNTANEIAKILKQAGAKRVDVWTIARA